MGHHSHHEHAGRGRLLIAMAIIGAFFAVQVVGALISGSLALLADAGHMLSDFGGLIVALLATIVAARPATDRHTFGYRRAEVFGALINALILLVVATLVAYSAVARLVAAEPPEVASGPMLLVAVIGLGANLAAFFVLRPAASDSINMRGAYLEVFGDLLGSIAVIVAALVIMATGFMPADAIASLAIAALIIPRALLLLRDALAVLSNRVPHDTSVAKIREHILGAEGVLAVHDVHVWSITSGAAVFSAHVVAAPQVFLEGRAGVLLDELSACLADHFDVAHSTFQLEPPEHADHEPAQHL